MIDFDKAEREQIADAVTSLIPMAFDTARSLGSIQFREGSFQMVAEGNVYLINIAMTEDAKEISVSTRYSGRVEDN